jgi:hypothetical protein
VFLHEIFYPIILMLLSDVALRDMDELKKTWWDKNIYKFISVILIDDQLYTLLFTQLISPFVWLFVVVNVPTDAINIS